MFIIRAVSEGVHRTLWPSKVLKNLPPEAAKMVVRVANIMGIGAFGVMLPFLVPVVKEKSYVGAAFGGGIASTLGYLARSSTITSLVKFPFYFGHEVLELRLRPWNSAILFAGVVSTKVYAKACLLTWAILWAGIHFEAWSGQLTLRYSNNPENVKRRERAKNLDLNHLGEEERKYLDQRSELMNEITEIRKKKEEFPFTLDEKEGVKYFSDTEEGQVKLQQLEAEEKNLQTKQQILTNLNTPIRADLTLANLYQSYSLWWHFSPTHWGQPLIFALIIIPASFIGMAPLGIFAAMYAVIPSRIAVRYLAHLPINQFKYLRESLHGVATKFNKSN